MTKIIARFYLPLFIIFATLLPANSYAFVPASIGGYGLPTPTAAAAASGGGTAAAAAGSVDLFAGATVVIIGAIVGYYAMDFMVSGLQYTTRVPLTNNPNLIVPAPIAAPTTAQTSSSSVIWQVCSGASSAACGSASTDPNQAATNFCTGFIVPGTTGSVSVVPPVPTGSTGYVSTSLMCSSYGPYSVYIIGSAQSVVGCPAGYTASGSSCILSDARVAAPDKACDFSRSGSALSMISDPDCAASGTALPIICASGGFSCSGVGIAPNGQPRSYSITPQADGGSIVQTYQQSYAQAQTQVTSATIQVDSVGSIVSVSGSTNIGSINGQTGAVTTGTAVQTQPSAAASSFPTDYARTGEASTAATQITTVISPKLDRIHDDLNPALVPTTAPVETQSMTTTIQQYKNISNDISSTSLDTSSSPVTPLSIFQPFQPAACTAVDFPITIGSIGHFNLRLDPCPVVVVFQDITGYVFALLTAYSIFAMFTGRRESGEEA